MSDIAIRVEELGKVYRIGSLKSSPDTLRDAISHAARQSVLRLKNLARFRRTPPSVEDSIWALRDVSFDVRHGDVVGIIGANGAGKSTLLKVLSRITEPTIGEVEVRGRVGSLLEVGTGFHPELTGRENVYLNGAILGMKREEINRKFDEIIAFAEVDRFVDTPVKRYSSGMYLRLAFAVAAHLEPEILIVDEVLAVGDASFQRKCLARMGDVAQEGRAVLFVSHNINAIQRLCSRCILLEDGELVEDGETARVVSRYMSSTASTVAASWIDTSQQRDRKGNGQVSVQALRYSSDRADLDYQAYPDGPVEIELALRAADSCTVESLAIAFYDHHGTRLVNADTLAVGHTLRFTPGDHRVCLRIEALHLNPGTYTLGFWVAGVSSSVYDYSTSTAQLEVLDVQEDRFGRRTGKDGLVSCRFAVRHTSREPEILV